MILILGTVVLVIFYALTTPAATLPSISDYAGRWDLVGAESDNIDRAIEAAVGSMNFITRPVARSRLRKRNVAFPYFRVDVNDSAVRVRHEQGLDVSYPASGAAVKTKAPDGTYVLATLQTEPVLTLSYVADGGHREDRYVLNPDRSMLTLSVRITSPNLPKAVTYKLVYRRSRE